MQFAQGNNLPKVKLTNQTAIHRMIYHFGPITRSEIAQRLGLTLPTITTNINAMIADGIVHEVGNPESKSIGRKANLVDIVANSRYFIGVEMRGTFRRLCITDFRGEVVYSLKDDIAYIDYDQTMQETVSMIKKALASKVVPADAIEGIGFCLPGLVDSAAGVLSVHPGYNWTDKPICADLTALTGLSCKITVENNTRARAVAARLFRREMLNNISSFAYLYISAGIACPLFINNISAEGSLVGEGEVGHMVMMPGGPQCSCGNFGCLEALASDRALIGQSIQALARGDAPILESICKGDVPSMQHILQAQAQGEQSIVEIIDTALKYLGVAIANIDNFVRPESMLIEGKLFKTQANRSKLMETVHENLYTATYAETRFVFVEPDEFSGAKGAAGVAIAQAMIAGQE